MPIRLSIDECMNQILSVSFGRTFTVISMSMGTFERPRLRYRCVVLKWTQVQRKMTSLELPRPARMIASGEDAGHHNDCRMSFFKPVIRPDPTFPRQTTRNLILKFQ